MSITRAVTLPSTRHRVLLGCGVAAGPLFTAVALVQVLTRDGFDLRRHPLSLLSLGDLGWVQIANFVVTGTLCAAFAVGLRRSCEPGWAGRWGPLLFGCFGLGLVMGGVFVTEPYDGFPPGAAADTVDGSAGWSSLLHDIAAGVAIDLALVACLLIGRRFRRAGEAGWAAYSLLTGLLGLLLSWWPDTDGISVRLAVVVVLVLAWSSSVAGRLLTAPPVRRAVSRELGAQQHH